MNNYEAKCKISWCDRKITERGAKGMCPMHYRRSRNGYDMDKPPLKMGGGWTSSHGYIYVGAKAKHRIIMEEHLGRKLHYNEIVHHKDGDTKNNDISNLEVMDRGDHIRLHNSGKTNEQRALEKEKYGFVLPNATRRAS